MKLDDLKRIKKEYEENMTHLCRSLFPTILEKPGALYHILSTHFAKLKFLYGDITREHKEYIYGFYDTDIEIKQESIKRYSQGEALFVCGSRRMRITVMVTPAELESFGSGGGL